MQKASAVRNQLDALNTMLKYTANPKRKGNHIQRRLEELLHSCRAMSQRNQEPSPSTVEDMLRDKTRQPTLTWTVCSLVIVLFTWLFSSYVSAPSAVSTPANAHAILVRPDGIAGRWEGFILARLGVRDEIIVNIGDDGSATLYCCSWGETQWPMGNLIINGNSIEFRIGERESGFGVFSGRVADNTIRGTYTWKGVNYPFLLSRKRPKETVLRRPRPQVPKLPFPYRRERVEFERGDLRISGILMIPRRERRYPAAVLLSGSGTHTADPEVPGKPRAEVWQWVLADHLARAGIATISLDSRGVGNSTGSYENATIYDLAEDAAAAVEFLRSRKDIDHTRVGLIGGSEGGVIGAISASKVPKIAFLVLTAAPAVPCDQVLVRQRKDLHVALGRTPAEIARGIKFNERLVELAKSDLAPAEILARMKEFESQGEPYCPVPEALNGQVEIVTRPVFRSLLHFDMPAVLQQLSCPVLAMYGDKDILVAADPNGSAMTDAFKKAMNADATVKVWPGLSHSFTETTNGIDPVNNDTIDPRVLDFIRDWVLKYTN